MTRDVAARMVASAGREGSFDLLAPGLYAWGVTVAWPVSHRFAPTESRILAVVALAALLVGAALARFWPAPARIAGTWVFLASCVASWALFAQSIAPAHLDPVQGVLGSLGWALFAIAWAGTKAPVSDARAVTQSDAPGPASARHASFIFGIIVTAALVPMVLAFWVVSIERALLAQAVALAAAIVIIARAVDLLTPASQGSEAELGPPARNARVRLRSAAPALMVLVGLGVAGAAYGLLR